MNIFLGFGTVFVNHINRKNSNCILTCVKNETKKNKKSIKISKYNGLLSYYQIPIHHETIKVLELLIYFVQRCRS